MLKAQEYIDELTACGRISFTIEQLSKAIGMNYYSTVNALRTLRSRKEVVSPFRGYYLILTPEFRKSGCLPADYFIDDLMSYLKERYYVSLLSAALYHGAAHQQPQIFQVMSQQKKLPLHCGNVYVEFIKNMHLEITPTQDIKTRTGYMKVSTPEATARDMMKYIRQSGGMNRIVTVLEELSEVMSSQPLAALAEKEEEYTWMHRLGYLLESLGKNELAEVLYKRIENSSMILVPLVPYTPITGCERNKKWRIAINANVEGDLNDT